MAGRPHRAASKGAPPGRPARTSAPEPDDRPPEGHVLLGEFGRAHGLRGEVRLKSYTADPADIAGYGPLLTAGGRVVAIRSVRPAGAAPDLLVVRVEGVEDRDAADALNRVAVFAHRDRLGAPADADEFFAADLVGLSVVDGNGRPVGSVVAVPNYGGGDLLEIRPAAGGPTALLPFLKSFVPAIDLAARRVTIDPPEDLFAPARPEPDA